MITGFNTDIDFNGRVYHVQTEDRGLKNPIVESLVYSGGEIVTSRKSPYADLIEAGRYAEDNVLKRMESQHRELIREIRNGKFCGEELKPFGHNIVTNRTFDQVVLHFLAEHVDLEEIKLNVTGPETFEEGVQTVLELQVVEGATARPVRGATVVIQLVTTGDHPRALFYAPTDDDGRVEAAFEIPVSPGANTAIVCRAEAGGRIAELKRLVKKKVAEVSADGP